MTPPAPAGPAPTGPGPSAGAGPIAAPAAPAGFTFAEDRAKWIPPYRLAEMQRDRDTMAQRFEQQEARLRVLMGVEAPPDPRAGQIRTALLEVFPELQPLVSGELQEQLRGSGSAEESYWRRHATTMAQSAVTGLAKELGITADKMPPNSRGRLAGELQRFIAADPSGERNARYDQGDNTLIDELIADLRGFYVEPVRRVTGQQGAAQVARTQRLPSAGPSGGVPPTPAGPKPTGKALHEAARLDFLARLQGSGG